MPENVNFRCLSNGRSCEHGANSPNSIAHLAAKLLDDALPCQTLDRLIAHLAVKLLDDTLSVEWALVRARRPLDRLIAQKVR